jgi:signal transduction histidine kinase
LVATRDIDSQGNTGIDLATAQKISLLMGGDLQVQSDTDVGTVFTMTKDWSLSS